MKTKTTIEAYLQITEIMEQFIEMSKKHKDRPVKLYATIDNVGFTDLVQLFYSIKVKSTQKALYMPGEFDDKFFMYYKPIEGCVIVIESEPTEILTSKKINLINLN